MANANDYISQLRTVTNGNLARTTIKNALNSINNNTGDADTLNGHNSNYFATVTDLWNGFFKV